jgi:hypothetical protein
LLLNERKKEVLVLPFGVAQQTSHPPQEQKTRVQIPQGYKVFRKNIAMLLWIMTQYALPLC